MTFVGYSNSMETIKHFLEQWDLLGFVIAAIISLVIGLLYKCIKNLVTMKRKPYNISRQKISRTVYDNRHVGDLSITVSYKDLVYEDSLTMLRIRLLNDGENDINYIRQCAKPISIVIIDADIVDVYLEPATEAEEATITAIDRTTYDLSWSLLKKDEYIDLVIVAKGKDFDSEQVQMIIRADGIDKIKSPEYKVWPQLRPMLIAGCIMMAGTWFLMPSDESSFLGIPDNVFWTWFIIILILFYIILILIQRIKWLKE